MDRPQNKNLRVGGGRPKGSVNRVTNDLRQLILRAVDKKGGVKWLDGLTDDQLIRLVARVIPQEHDVNQRGTVNVIIHEDGNGTAIGTGSADEIVKSINDQHEAERPERHHE